MRIYLAGLHSGQYPTWPITNPKCECFKTYHYPHQLESYHYIQSPKRTDNIRRRAADLGVPAQLFLDSGAFSAHTQGVQIDRAQYAEFINQHQDLIEVASVLDVIGDPAATWENQQWFDEQHVAVLPCFHFGEPLEYLEAYVKRYPYITLGGMVGIDRMVLREWLDTLFTNYLTHADGTPKVKVHGFGMTLWELMARYPWYSVDSTSWLSGSKHGFIYLWLDKKQSYIRVADGNKGEKKLGQSFATLSPPEQARIVDYVEGLGYSMPALIHADAWALRNKFNCDFFLMMQGNGTDRFMPTYSNGGLFDA